MAAARELLQMDGVLTTYRCAGIGNGAEEQIAAIIARHFSASLASVEGERNVLADRVVLFESKFSQEVTSSEALRADLAAAKAERIEDVTRAQQSANGFYHAIVKQMEPHFPKDTRDLEWDVLPSTIGGVMVELIQLRADLAAKGEEADRILSASCTLEMLAEHEGEHIAKRFKETAYILRLRADAALAASASGNGGRG